MSLNRRIRRVYIDQEDKLLRSTPMSNVLKVFTLALLVALASAHAMAEKQKDNRVNKGNNVDEVMVILSSDSTQTQGMAMVLVNTMAEQGTKVNVLLCDEVVDLVLYSY